MTKRKLRGPVILFGPATEFQPWVVNDLEVVRNHLQDKYGLVGIIHNPTSIPYLGGGFFWLNVGGA